MDEIKGIRIVSLTGEKEYGIEDGEVREELANVVDGAPEELDSFKEAFEKFKEGGEALAGITAEVAAVGKAVTDEATRAEQAEQTLDDKITAEIKRARGAEQVLDEKITEEAKATDEKIAEEQTRAEMVELALANNIANAPNLALRSLYVAAGAEYNDSGVDKTKTAPWGETITHKAGYYYLNGIGDITEEQMANIYAYKDVIYKLNLGRIAQSSPIRTFYPIKVNQVQQVLPVISAIAVFNNSTIEIASWTTTNLLNTTDTLNMLSVNTPSLYDIFRDCKNLKLVYPINCSKVTLFSYVFKNCPSLEYMMLYGLKASVSFSDSPNITKKCILYIINNASPTSAITITLHANAYARLANDADIVAALEAQPLITLVSA